METVNPIVFNCNDLTLRRVHKVLGQSSAIPDVLKALRDEKELYRKRRLKILPFTVDRRNRVRIARKRLARRQDVLSQLCLARLISMMKEKHYDQERT